jgi:hypothetical protein
LLRRAIEGDPCASSLFIGRHCSKHCYQQAARAFNTTILPDLDEDKVKEVLKMEVLRPEDFRFD